MPTNRTPKHRGRKPVKITPDILAAYARVLALNNDPMIDEYEEDGDGGKRREYLAACHELHQMLGRKLWQADVIDTIGEDVPPGWLYQQGPERVRDWQDAHVIRVRLDQALAEGQGKAL